MSKRTEIEVDAKRFENEDNCLAAAEAAWMAEHGSEGWTSVEARWTDNNRDTITLSLGGGPSEQ